MIRVSVLYPAGDGVTFDHDYYRDQHIPLVKRAWGIERAEIDRGIDGPYVGAVHLFMDSPEALQAAMGSPATAEVMADIANYTNSQPVIQVSEVV